MAVIKVLTEKGWEIVDLSDAVLGEELLINREIKRAINSLSFNGNWENLGVGEYGYDRWLKVDATNKGQIVEAGKFAPNTKHSLSYWLDGERKHEIIKSPVAGHWLIKAPFVADEFSLRKGVGYGSYIAESNSQRRAGCRRYREKLWVSVDWNTVVQNIYRGYLDSVKFRGTKRVVPELNILPNSTLDITVTAVTNKGFDYRTDWYRGSASGDKSIVFMADAELYLTDLEEV